MEALLCRARLQPDLEQITLAVTGQQAAARTLYLHLGFQIYGREPQALMVGKDYADEDLMTLKIRKT